MKRRFFILCTVLIFLLSLFLILYFTVTFEITLQVTGNGTLQAEKLRVHPFESVRIRAVPNYESGENVTLQSISVNGKDRTANVRFGTLRLRFIWGNQTVCAEFQTTAEPVRANAAVFV